jgi:competence protein ComEC
VSGAEGAERTLVPALVVGDDRDMPAEVTADFQVTGLTHLLAVSGTNLTLVVGFLLILARWVGIRARGLVVVGILGVAGFVLLARTEPSVVRAAAMGSVALIGMSSGGRERGVRALGVAVWVLLLLDPWMALSIGFALSALATAGILFIAPPCRDALQRWLPQWLAEAVAVPLAAQLACTPLVAAISDQVSLVAVVANMLVAPAVGPATVLGLTGGLVVLVVEPLGELLGRVAGWCGWWIIAVAERSAELPTAAVGWSSGPTSLAVLTVLCVVLGWVLPAVLSRRRWALPLAVALLVLVVRPLPTPGWPPAGWVLVMCDVGQGDALVLNAGSGSVVVVDTGPDPAALDRCLDRLGVREVHTVVLTHFHADHVGGLPALWEERPPGQLLVTGLAEPASAAAAIREQAAEAGVTLRVPTQGEVRRAGAITWQVLGPSPQLVSGAMAAEGSPANNASLVLLVETHGVRILLSGDVEPEAQQVLDESFPALRVDVLKVPHHGSAYQDLDLLTGLGARLALVPVGVDNDYGHPSGEVLTALERSGALVARTDLSGDVAVVADEGQLTLRELSTASSAMR